MLGDALRSLLLGKSQEEWDTVLPQIMRAYRSTPHSSTRETLNFLMLGRETRVPDHLTYHVPLPEGPVHEYVRELVDRMRTAHEVLREKQWQVRGEDSDEPPLYQTGDWVWMLSYQRKRGQSAKLQPKFVGPYCILEVLANHTYRVECSGQISVQSEKHLKPYWASPGAVGQAPPLLEPARRPTRGGRTAPTQEWEFPYRLPEENPEIREPPPQPIPEEPAPPEPPKVPDPHDQPAPQEPEPAGPPPMLPDQVDQPTPEVGEGGVTNTERQATLSDTEGLRRSQRTRRPPGYLGEYYCGQVEGGPFDTTLQGSTPTHGRGLLEDTQHCFLPNTQSLRVATERSQVPDNGQSSAQSSKQASKMDEEETLRVDS